jgi:hypothetical protein
MKLSEGEKKQSDNDPEYQRITKTEDSKLGNL